jgi:hypothetical protein
MDTSLGGNMGNIYIYLTEKEDASEALFEDPTIKLGLDVRVYTLLSTYLWLARKSVVAHSRRFLRRSDH